MNQNNNGFDGGLLLISMSAAALAMHAGHEYKSITGALLLRARRQCRSARSLVDSVYTDQTLLQLRELLFCAREEPKPRICSGKRESSREIERFEGSMMCDMSLQKVDAWAIITALLIPISALSRFSVVPVVSVASPAG